MAKAKQGWRKLTNKGRSSLSLREQKAGKRSLGGSLTKMRESCPSV